MATGQTSVYSPQRAGSRMEGDYKDAYGNPVSTRADYDAGRSSYVTLAGNPAYAGMVYSFQAPDANGVMRDYVGRVMDTGDAFNGNNPKKYGPPAPEGRFDVAIDRDLTNAQMNSDPLSGATVAFTPIGWADPRRAQFGAYTDVPLGPMAALAGVLSPQQIAEMQARQAELSPVSFTDTNPVQASAPAPLAGLLSPTSVADTSPFSAPSAQDAPTGGFTDAVGYGRFSPVSAMGAMVNNRVAGGWEAVAEGDQPSVSFAGHLSQPAGYASLNDTGSYRVAPQVRSEIERWSPSAEDQSYANDRVAAAFDAAREGEIDSRVAAGWGADYAAPAGYATNRIANAFGAVDEAQANDRVASGWGTDFSAPSGYADSRVANAFNATDEATANNRVSSGWDSDFSASPQVRNAIVDARVSSGWDTDFAAAAPTVSPSPSDYAAAFAQPQQPVQPAWNSQAIADLKSYADDLAKDTIGITPDVPQAVAQAPIAARAQGDDDTSDTAPAKAVAAAAMASPRAYAPESEINIGAGMAPNNFAAGLAPAIKAQINVDAMAGKIAAAPEGYGYGYTSGGGYALQPNAALNSDKYGAAFTGPGLLGAISDGRDYSGGLAGGLLGGLVGGLPGAVVGAQLGQGAQEGQGLGGALGSALGGIGNALGGIGNAVGGLLGGIGGAIGGLLGGGPSGDDE